MCRQKQTLLFTIESLSSFYQVIVELHLIGIYIQYLWQEYLWILCNIVVTYCSCIVFKHNTFERGTSL